MLREPTKTEAKFNTVRDLPATGAQGTMTIEAQEVGDDPSVVIYHVTIQNASGVWTETIPTKEQLEVFLKGFRVALSMGLDIMNLPDPAIPG